MYRRDFIKQSAALLAVSGLPSYVGQLGDMKKRVGLARALITDPEIVLYDEPTAGLDPEISASINTLMRELAQELRVTSLIVTHHVGTVRTVADRVGMLDDGELRYIGTADEFLNSTEPRLVRFLGPKLD